MSGRYFSFGCWRPVPRVGGGGGCFLWNIDWIGFVLMSAGDSVWLKSAF